MRHESCRAMAQTGSGGAGTASRAIFRCQQFRICNTKGRAEKQMKVEIAPQGTAEGPSQTRIPWWKHGGNEGGHYCVYLNYFKSVLYFKFICLSKSIIVIEHHIAHTV